MAINGLPNNQYNEQQTKTAQNRAKMTQERCRQQPTAHGTLPPTTRGRFRTTQGTMGTETYQLRKEEHPRASNLGINWGIELEIVNTLLGSREKSTDTNKALAAMLEQGMEKMASAPQPLHYQHAMFQDNWQGYNTYPNQYSSSWMNQPNVSWEVIPHITITIIFHRCIDQPLSLI
ncbi:hypothetical protein M9H77_23411 [Catharanthus roseus]|uniref:Uncharacterized protein n=1 Tax=Catharanthus roseus TaxID=4058 RepID=A0ACC0AXD0_CATRO|nr:hypothetical protein M9H77_23411 [Catharanthus roseus]